MKKFVFLCLPILFFINTSGAADPTPSVQTTWKKPGSNHQITVGYWNDNLIYQDFFRKILRVGPDDFVTTCFWSQIAYFQSQKWLIFDTYYNVLTNKTDAYRFDLVTLRLSVEKDTKMALYQVGTGLIFRGNFGGATIQNGYHQLFDYSTVDLPYTNNSAMGLLAFIKAEPYLIKKDRQILKLSICNSYRTAAGPSNFRIGINSSYRFGNGKQDFAIITQGRIGYVHYYHLDRPTSPIFHQGIGYTMMITGILKNKYGFSFWMTENQYGHHNPHYGISFSLKPKGRRLLRISDIMVP